MSHPTQNQFIELNGCRLHYLEGGQPEGPPLLMVHGLTREAHSFDPVIAQLGGRYRCLALDVRGRGGSQWTAAETYATAQYADDVLAFMDALDLESVSYLGTSMGGIIAMTVAAREPQRFVRLALNDIGPEIDPAGARRIGGHLAGIPPYFETFAALLDYEINRFPWLASHPRATLQEQYRHMAMLEPDGRCRFHYDPLIATGRAVTPETLLAQQAISWRGLRNLTCPLLLIRGAETDLLSPATVAAMQQAQPEMVVAEVPGVGHAPYLSEAESRDALDAFFRG